jgi:hypothetical protein
MAGSQCFSREESDNILKRGSCSDGKDDKSNLGTADRCILDRDDRCTCDRGDSYGSKDDVNFLGQVDTNTDCRANCNNFSRGHSYSGRDDLGRDYSYSDGKSGCFNTNEDGRNNVGRYYGHILASNDSYTRYRDGCNAHSREDRHSAVRDYSYSVGRNDSYKRDRGNSFRRHQSRDFISEIRFNICGEGEDANIGDGSLNIFEDDDHNSSDVDAYNENEYFGAADDSGDVDSVDDLDATQEPEFDDFVANVRSLVGIFSLVTDTVSSTFFGTGWI